MFGPIHSWQHDLDYADEAKRVRGMTYAEYLESNHWWHVVQLAAKRADYRCQICAALYKKLIGHHVTYDNVGNEARRDVLVACDCCIVHIKHIPRFSIDRQRWELFNPQTGTIDAVQP